MDNKASELGGVTRQPSGGFGSRIPAPALDALIEHFNGGLANWGKALDYIREDNGTATALAVGRILERVIELLTHSSTDWECIREWRLHFEQDVGMHGPMRCEDYPPFDPGTSRP